MNNIAYIENKQKHVNRDKQVEKCGMGNNTFIGPREDKKPQRDCTAAVKTSNKTNKWQTSIAETRHGLATEKLRAQH